MRILVRLPNWLGDLVMSTGFIHALSILEPDSSIDVIIKDTLSDCIPLLEGINNHIVYSKSRYHGISGAIKFGHICAEIEKYDKFFSLPDSFSSALSGFFSKCPQRIGYAAQFRSPLLTHAFQKPAGIHRAQEYISLLRLYYSQKDIECTISLKNNLKSTDKICDTISNISHPKVVLNIHSAAVSRRIPLQKASEIGKRLLQTLDCTLIFTGSSSDAQVSQTVIEKINTPERCIDMTGKTTLGSLASMCSISDIVISSDSGIAHLANALGKPVIVLFGAGNEQNTAPYNKEHLSIIRVPDMACAPCVENTCKYSHVNCMNNLDEAIIAVKAREVLRSIVC